MKKDAFKDSVISYYIGLLLKNKNYKSIYKSLIINEKLFQTYNKVYVDPIYQRKIYNFMKLRKYFINKIINYN